jgi:hypothetical protein
MSAEMSTRKDEQLALKLDGNEASRAGRNIEHRAARRHLRDERPMALYLDHCHLSRESVRVLAERISQPTLGRH